MLFSPARASPTWRRSPRPPPHSGDPHRRPDTSLSLTRNPRASSSAPLRSVSMPFPLSGPSPHLAAPSPWHPPSIPQPHPSHPNPTPPPPHHPSLPLP